MDTDDHINLQIDLDGQMARRFAASLARAIESSSSSAKISKRGHGLALIAKALEAEEKAAGGRG